jgi:hypothetical protein
MYHTESTTDKTIREWYMKFQQSGTGRPSTVTIDSVLANSKTQNAFLFPVHAMFRHKNLQVRQGA